ncbi:MAG: CoA transferase subunit A [Firmicutes bacterium]|nr:CoA transferase subunit A [Bacillota bacterium]
MQGEPLKGRSRADKRMTLDQAIAAYVHDGDSITFSGMGGEQCVAQTYEIIRQGKKDLTIIGDSPCEAADMLIGAGLAKKVEVAWIGYAVAGLAVNYRRAVEEHVPRPIEVEEYSNYTMGLRFLAGAMGIPFMPTRSLAGSDIPKYNEKIRTTSDPYSGKPVTLVPAARPDVAVVHVHRCDKRGNAQMLSFSSNLENIGRAAKRTIVTCEEIISTDEVRRTGNLTILPEYCVDAVVELPYACHPWNMPYSYAYDIPFHMEQMAQIETRDGFLEWLDKWVYGCKDHADYCSKVGWDRLQKLTRLERKFCKPLV